MVLIFKIGYRLSTIDLKSIDQIEKQVTETYRMVINNLEPILIV